MWEVSWRLNRTAIYWPPTLIAITGFLSLGPVPHSSIFSPTGLISNCSIGTWGPPLLGADLLYCIFSPTDWTSCPPSYIIIWRPFFFLRALQIAPIQPVHGQGYILIFLDQMHLLFTQVHFLFWQLAGVNILHWGCRIHWLLLCRRLRPPLQRVSWMTLNNLARSGSTW